MLYNSKWKNLCRHLYAGIAACLMGTVMFSCSDTYDLDEDQPKNYTDIYDYVKGLGNFNTYVRLIDDLGQTEYLSKTGSITLFIANDDAFGEFFKSNKWGVTRYEDLSLSQKRLLLGTAMIGNVYPVSMLSTASAGNASLKGRAVRQYTTLALTDSVEMVKVQKTPVYDTDGVTVTSYTYANDGLPSNGHWDWLRESRDEFPLYKDASGTPTLIVMTPHYFDTNRLLYSDMDFALGLPEGTLEAELNANGSGAYINGAHILNSQFCKNGYIHEIDHVLTPLDNMAEVILKNDDVSVYSSLLERFAAPYYSKTVTDDYNLTFGTNYDSVFVKRYYATRSVGSTWDADRSFSEDAYQKGMESDVALQFDPGWTRYVAPGAHFADDALKENMAVMLVPTNEALLNWWDHGGGSDIKRQYGVHPLTDCTDYDDLIYDMSETPINLLEPLVNVNMLPSFTSAVPSRFNAVLNEANEVLGIQKSHVEKVDMASNGLIYYTNTVFTPASYSTVLYPALVRASILDKFYNSVSNDNYDAYLNSTVSRYHLVLPSNDAMLTYIDPVSYGQKNQHVLKFYLNPRQNDSKGKLYAEAYNITINPDGTYEETSARYVTRIGFSNSSGSGGLYDNDVLYRCEDIMDNMIAIGDLVPGKKYYPTKGNMFVRIEGAESKDASGITIAGSYQAQYGIQIPVTEFYDKSKETNGGLGNGYAYVVEQMPTSTYKSVTDVLASYSEFSEFFNIVEASNSTAMSVGAPQGGKFFSASQSESPLAGHGNLVAHSLDKNHNDVIYQLLNAYHYTVYAPTNAAMAEAYAAGLPSIADLEQAELDDEALVAAGEEPHFVEEVRSVMRDFVRYHVQTNSIYIDEGFNAGKYESARSLMQLQDTVYVDEHTGETIHTWKDEKGDGYYDCLTGSPYPIQVNAVSSTGMTITDNMGNQQTINRTDGLINLQACEYWLGNSNSGIADVENAKNIANSSSAVIHAVDHPLYYNYDPSWESTDPDKFRTDQFHYIKREIVNNEE